MTHRIRRLVFEAGLHGRERVAGVQNRISVFSRGRLDTVLAESLAPLAGHHELLSFPKVELDVGRISLSHLEKDLETGIARALKEWALRAMIRHGAEAGLKTDAENSPLPVASLPSSEENSSSNAADSLAHFLELGVLPDSAMRSSNHTAEFELLTALDTRPADVCATVRLLGQKQLVRRRIAGQFSPDAMHRLVAALDPVNAPWMSQSIKLLCRLHAERPFVRLQNRGFAQLLWELALEYLSLHHWQAQDPASLLRFLLQKLAARQKNSYEVLLADVALRRGWEPEKAQVRDTGPQSQVTSAILSLLEQDIFGFRLIYAPRFVVRPEFQHLYTDFDVLAYWLRWRKLPAWSSAINADEMARRIGPLLREIPAEVRRPSSKPAAATAQPADQARKHSTDFSVALQIERWLLYGLWPADVTLPQDQALASWLETQDQAAWHSALRHCGAQEHAVQRIAGRLSPEFLLKLVGWLAGQNAQPACGLVESLWALEPSIGKSSLPPWREQVSRYALLHALQHLSSNAPGPLAVEALARTALHALSLRYQISCRRLLRLLQQKTHGQHLLREVYSRLYSGLDAMEAEREVEIEAGMEAGADLLFPATASAAMHGSDVVLHYLEHGSLPEAAAGLSFRQLQRLATGLDDDQLIGLARSSLALLAHDRPAAQRMATLFSPKAFARAVSLVSPRMSFVDGMEHAFVRLAARLSMETARLLITARIFLLEQAAGSTEARSEQELIFSLLTHISQAMGLGLTPAQLQNELTGLAAPKSAFAKVLAKLDSAAEQKRLGSAEPALSLSKGALACAINTQARATALHNTHLPRRLAGQQSFSVLSRIEADLSAHTVPPGRSTANAASNDESRSGLRMYVEQENPLRSHLDAFLHLVRTGEIPWWGAVLVRQPLMAWLPALLENSPAPLLAGLRSAAAVSTKAVERLIRYVPKLCLAALVRKGVPEFGGLLILYIETGSSSALGKSGGLPGTQRPRAEALHWRETLLYVLDENPSSRAAAQAVHTLCIGISRQLDLSMDDYLGSLVRYAGERAAAHSGYSALARMLSQMQESPKLCDSPTLCDSGELTHQTASRPERMRHPGEVDQSAPEDFPTLCGNGELAGQTASRPQRMGHPGEVDQSASKPQKIDHPGEAEPKTERGLAFPDQDDQAGQFEYLLRYGALPQKPGADDLAAFMDHLALRLQSHPEKYRYSVQAATHHDLERRRMARLLSPQMLEHLWPILLPFDHAQAVLCLHELHAAAVEASTASAKTALGHACVEELLRTVALTQESRWNPAAYLRAAVRRLVEDFSLRASVIVERLRARISRQPKSVQDELGPALDRLERETAVTLLDRKTPATPRAVEQKSAIEQRHAAEQKPSQAVERNGSLLDRKQPESRVQRPSAKFPTGEPFYIRNAGAVLLWPFLGRYFQNLGLLEKNAFRGETESNRAVHLVQYLAAGALEAPEHELLLNKVLCGVPPEQPLDPVAPLAGNEEALSTQLLHAVIANWEKLRNTSIDGLRASFLLREGRLLRKASDDSWSLTVSTKGYDVLLDSLPWNFSTVRLPWMQTVLHVKWR